MVRGRSGSPSRGVARSKSFDAVQAGRGRSMDQSQERPGPPVRSRSRQGRTMTPNHELKRGKRPQAANESAKKKGPGRSFKKVGKKGYRGVKKVSKNGVRRFQKTRVGKRIAPEDKCGVGKFCSYIFAIVLLLASSVGLVIATGNVDLLTDALNELVPDFDLSNLQDNFAGTDTINAKRWQVSEPKAGLAIEIQNALDDNWGTIFQLAFADWEYGIPKALQLSEVKIAYEQDCSAVNGKIKVCNGNYGKKPWRGIAECLLGNNNFYANCVCKMNDYYLKNADSDLKQYTMCHEMGHGFGLPHTNENFNDPDLGNCLDYTENFGFSKHPDEGNYETLAEWYGQVSRRRLRGSTIDGTIDDASSARLQITHDVPESVMKRRSEAIAKLEESNYSSIHTDQGWRMLHKKLHGEEHEFDLGEGYKLSVHMLLAQ